jgi:hypothetical protein
MEPKFIEVDREVMICRRYQLVRPNFPGLFQCIPHAAMACRSYHPQAGGRMDAVHAFRIRHRDDLVTSLPVWSVEKDQCAQVIGGSP